MRSILAMPRGLFYQRTDYQLFGLTPAKVILVVSVNSMRNWKRIVRNVLATTLMQASRFLAHHLQN